MDIVQEALGLESSMQMFKMVRFLLFFEIGDLPHGISKAWAYRKMRCQ